MAYTKVKLKAVALKHLLVLHQFECYKTEGHGLLTLRGKLFFFFNLPDTSSRIRPWGFTQPLTEMSTRSRKNNISGE
jgi:hypothetical protein